jgi:hypothetical protein
VVHYEVKNVLKLEAPVYNILVSNIGILHATRVVMSKGPELKKYNYSEAI